MVGGALGRRLQKAFELAERLLVKTSDCLGCRAAGPEFLELLAIRRIGHDLSYTNEDRLWIDERCSGRR